MFTHPDPRLHRASASRWRARPLASKRLAVCALSLGMLAGCGNGAIDPASALLAHYDFTDNSTAARVIAALPETDRPAFRTYLVHHYALSKAFCGEVLVDKEGRQAVTIADAVTMTRIREASLERARRPVDLASLPPQVRKAMQIDKLVERRDLLADRIAVEEQFEKGQYKPEVHDKLRAEISGLDAELTALGYDPWG